MTGPKRVSPRPVDEAPPCSLDDLLMRVVLAAANQAVTSLSTAARTHVHERPAVTAHIEELAQQIAGITLDALRTWPDAAR